MPKTIEGKLDAKGLKFGVVVGRFNDFVSGRLLDGCLDALLRHGADDKDIVVAKVPGSFEIPLVAQAMAKSKKFDAVIALGAVIRGSTPHFDYVAAEASKGIAHVMLETGVPVAFGIITTDNLEQAIERAGAKSGNKGASAATTAIEMARVLAELKA
jgi:6,7-dimethyl-8-ribityllumazine synthase